MLDGLSHNSVNGIARDDYGFMWICTDDGINRYDGRAVKKIKISQSGAPSSIYKDNANRLWITSDQGVSYYDPGKDSIAHFGPRHFGSSAIDVSQDSEGTIWIATRRGLFKFNEANSTFTHYLMERPMKNLRDSSEYFWQNRIFQMEPDQNGNLWLACLGGVFKFSTKNGKFTPIIYQEYAPLAVRSYTSISFDEHGSLWVGSYSDKGIIKYDTSTHVTERVSGLDFFEVADVKVAKGKGVWVATRRYGLYFYDHVTRRAEHYQNDPFNHRSLATNKLQSLFVDTAGLLWIGTENSGVDRLSALPEKFESPGNPPGILLKEITQICEVSPGNLWIGTRNGLVFFDKKKNKFDTNVAAEGERGKLSGSDIADVSRDHDGNVWVCTENGVSLYIKAKRTWKNYQLVYNGSHPGLSVCITSWGDVYVGSRVGVFKFNEDRDEFQNWKTIEQLKAVLKGDFYVDIFESRQKTLWFATSSRMIFNVDRNFNNTNFFNPDRVPTVVRNFEDDQYGNIWMATAEGVLRLDHSTHQFQLLTVSNGLPSNNIVSIKCLSPSDVWIGTTVGLSQVNWSVVEKKILSIKNYTKASGLEGSFFSSNLPSLSTGELCYGGVDGFNIFTPSTIMLNDTPPSVSLSSFKVFDKDVDILGQRTLSLDYNNNNFSFEMAALSFDHSENNEFAYQLIGFDPKPTYTGTKNYASYTNVPPGNYVLHITAANNDGFWNREGYKLDIVITPPVWKTLWFQALAIVAGIGILGTIYFRRVAYVRQKESYERSILEARLAALRSQINPHFIFNCLNSIDYYLLAAQPLMASDYLSRFSKLIRSILENSVFELISLEKELDTIKMYIQLEEMRFGKEFNSIIEVDDLIDPRSTLVPPLILQPFVENSILHGFAKKAERAELKIEIHREGKWIVCSIIDNGTGREKNDHESPVRKRMGMSITNNRLKLLANDIKKEELVKINDLVDSEGQPAGTKVTIKIADVN